MNNKPNILLTSIGLSCEKAATFVQEFFTSTDKIVTIIVTASEGKKQNKYVLKALEQFQTLGFTDIHLVDLETGDQVPENTDILYVSGGNTFTLMYFARLAQLDMTIKKILDRGGLYIGVSAGSIIMGDTVRSAEILGDENIIGLDDYQGFNFIPQTIFPHADDVIREEVKNSNMHNNAVFIENDEVVNFTLY